MYPGGRAVRLWIRMQRGFAGEFPHAFEGAGGPRLRVPDESSHRSRRHIEFEIPVKPAAGDSAQETGILYLYGDPGRPGATADGIAAFPGANKFMLIPFIQKTVNVHSRPSLK